MEKELYEFKKELLDQEIKECGICNPCRRCTFHNTQLNKLYDINNANQVQKGCGKPCTLDGMYRLCGDKMYSPVGFCKDCMEEKK